MPFTPPLKLRLNFIHNFSSSKLNLATPLLVIHKTLVLTIPVPALYEQYASQEFSFSTY